MTTYSVDNLMEIGARDCCTGEWCSYAIAPISQELLDRAKRKVDNKDDIDALRLHYWTGEIRNGQIITEEVCYPLN